MKRPVGRLFVCLILFGFTPWIKAATTIIGTSNASMCFNESQMQFASDPDYCTDALRNDNLSLNDRAATYSNRGIIYSRRGEYEKALADHTMALEFAPGSAQIHVNRGNVYHHLQQYEAALKEYQVAADLEDGYLAYYNAGLTLLKLKREKEAVEMLEKALSRAPENSIVRQRLLELIRP